MIRLSLANPLPPDFPRGGTWAKRASRFKWRLQGTWERYWKPSGAVAILALVVLVFIWECWAGDSKKGGWDDVPFGRWVLKERDGHRPLPRINWLGIGPFRMLISLQVRSPRVDLAQARSFKANSTFDLQIVMTSLSLSYPIKHLLPTSILPSSMTPPSFLCPPPPRPSRPRHSKSRRSTSRASSPSCPSSFPHLIQESPRVALDTAWVTSALFDLATCVIVILQFTFVGLLLGTYSPFTIPPHIIFFTIRGRLRYINKTRSGIMRTMSCLETVFSTFPESDGEEEKEEEDDWVCTICFEGKQDEIDHLSKVGGKSPSAKCKLPCGHKCEWRFSKRTLIAHELMWFLLPPQRPRSMYAWVAQVSILLSCVPLCRLSTNRALL